MGRMMADGRDEQQLRLHCADHKSWQAQDRHRLIWAFDVLRITRPSRRRVTVRVFLLMYDPGIATLAKLHGQS